MIFRLTLRLIGLHLVIHSDDKRLIQFFQELWEPFVVGEMDGSPLATAELRRADRGWSVRWSGRKAVFGDDPWDIAAGLSYEMIKRTLEAQPGFIGIHAALVSVNSMGILLLGASGAGKTTSTLGFLARGAFYGGDDLALVDVDTAEVYPFLKPLSVRPLFDDATDIPRWGIPDWLPPPTTQFYVPAGHFPCVTREPVALGCLAILNLQPEVGLDARPLSLAEAIAVVSQYFRWVDGVDLGLVRRLCERAPAIDVRYGDTDALIDTIVSITR